LCALASLAGAQAQPATVQPGNGSGTPGSVVFLVPPHGAAFSVGVHAGDVCILAFPEPLDSRGIASSPDFEIQSWGKAGVAIRATAPKAKTTLAVATITRSVQVNVTLTVVDRESQAYTYVTFQPASAEEAFEAQVKAGIAERIAPLEARLGKKLQHLDQQIDDRAEAMLAARILKREASVDLNAHQRNRDNVIVHVMRAILIGNNGYLLFDIENRSSTVFQVASVRVNAAERDVAGAAVIASQAIDRDPGLLGIVAANTTASGVVAVRGIDQIAGQRLVVTITGPGGSGTIRLDRGIVVR
jgi:hypothetical protein